MTLKQTSSWPPFLPVLLSPSWRWCGHGAELLRLFPARSWTRALGKVWISSLVSSLTLVFGCTVDLDNPTSSVIPASCPSEQWIIFWCGGPYPVLFPYLTNVINDVMTTSVKKWPRIWNNATSHSDTQLPACHHVPAPLPSRSLVSIRAGNLQRWLCSAGQGFHTPMLPYVCPLFPPAYFILVENEDFGCRFGIFTHLAEGSHGSSFGQAAKNQEILAKNLKWMEFKGEGMFTQSYHSLQQVPARSAVPCSASHSPNAPWKYEGLQSSLWASPELIRECADAGVSEEAGWRTSAKGLIRGISHSLCRNHTSSFYSQLLRDLSQGTEVLRASVPMLARKHASILFCFADLSCGFIALHP